MIDEQLEEESPVKIRKRQSDDEISELSIPEIMKKTKEAAPKVVEGEDVILFQ